MSRTTATRIPYRDKDSAIGGTWEKVNKIPKTRDQIESNGSRVEDRMAIKGGRESVSGRREEEESEEGVWRKMMYDLFAVWWP